MSMFVGLLKIIIQVNGLSSEIVCELRENPEKYTSKLYKYNTH